MSVKWKDFFKYETDSAICLNETCKKRTVSRLHGNTSGMKSHMITHHKKEFDKYLAEKKEAERKETANVTSDMNKKKPKSYEKYRPKRTATSVSVLPADLRKKVDNEITDYFEIPADGDIDPVVYWTDAAIKLKFPVLAELAEKYLSAPGTAVESERLFSTAGETVTDLRQNMLPETLEMTFSSS